MLDDEKIQKLMQSAEVSGEAVEEIERYRAAAVFDRLHDEQLQLRDVRVMRDRVDDAWYAIQPKLKEFEADMSRYGLLGQTVTISGSGIEVPIATTSFANAKTFITTVEAPSFNESTVEEYYRLDDAEGLLAGVTLRFEELEGSYYVPRLAYQVEVSRIATPNSQNVLYATAIIGESILEFTEDKRIDDLVSILERLYRACPDNFTTVTMINKALAEGEVMDAARFRHIAYHAEKLINAQPSVELEDTLLELIMHYNKPNRRVRIRTDSMTQDHSNDEDDTGQRQKDVSIQEQIVDYVFLDAAYEEDDEPGAENVFDPTENETQRKLYIFLKNQKGNLGIPVTGIQEYSIL